MRKLAEALYSLCIAVWVGGLFAIGYVAVPVLFGQLSDRMQAGHIAGVMFGVGGAIGMVCAVTLLGLLQHWHGARTWHNPVTRVVALMLVLGLIGQFVVQPEIAAIKAQVYPSPVAESALHAQFARWHGVSSVLYLLQAVLGIALVVWQRKGHKT